MRFLIILLIILPPLALDEYAASMPFMVETLKTSIHSVQFSITIYLLAQGIAQIFSGPISDYYGRKRPLMVMLFIYLIGSALCCFSTQVNMLLIGRFLQGLGMGGCAITAPCLIGDVYKGEKFKKVSSSVVFFYSLVPIVAPIIGGYIQAYSAWQTNFILLFVLPLAVTIFIYFKLPETHKSSQMHSLHYGQLIKNYGLFFCNKRFIENIYVMSILWSTIVIFSVCAPFIIQSKLGFGPEGYGKLSLLVGLSFCAGSFLSQKINIGSEKNNTKIMLITQIFIILMMLISSSFKNNVVVFIIPVCFFTMISGIIFPKLYSNALSIFTNHLGIASSLIGSTMLCFSVLATMIVEKLQINEIKAFGSLYLVLSFSSLLVHFFLKKKSV